MKPSANMNAETMSQIVVLENPASASPAFMMPRSGRSVQARIAMAPIGIGCRMKPAIVATNTASSLHAGAETPAGAGMNHRTMPIATQMRPRTTGGSPWPFFFSDI